MGYDVEELVDGIQGGMSAPGGRAAIARAITLVESDRPDHRALARTLLEKLDSRSEVIRIGISGVPGVGKSTFIESFGTHLTAQGL